MPLGQSSIRVLIVEDKEPDALLMVEQLKRAGYRPQWQRVADEAGFLASLTQGPDIILSDSNLPQFRALDAQSVLHECGLDIPFLLVSGSPLGAEGAEVLRRGASGHLLKKDLARLGTVVRETLRRASSQARPTVWIVDEGPDRGNAFAFCLRAMEYRSQVFANLESALLALASATPPPLLLVADLKRWDPPTPELLSRCKQTTPSLKIIAVQTRSESDDSTALSLSSDVVLTKPFSYQELVSAISEALD